MQISDLNSAGAMPALEMTIRYAGQRQRLLAHNIANINTPNFVARDVDPKAFQSVLSKAVSDRRERTGGAFGRLEWQETAQIQRDPRDGSLRLGATNPHGGVLRHDRNATDLERLMQDMVENLTVFRAATDLMRRQKSTLQAAISQRV
ncbi:MAG: hypothetical protein AAGA55_05170 [Planctomycetota bacterium]